MLCAFSVAHLPDADPARRPQWLVFDERFAHSYPLAAQRAIADSQRVAAYLRTRADVDPASSAGSAALRPASPASPWPPRAHDWRRSSRSSARVRIARGSTPGNRTGCGAILWFPYSQTVLRSPVTGVERLRRDLWPLFSWNRDFDGKERLQVLAISGPVIPDNKSITRKNVDNDPDRGSFGSLWVALSGNPVVDGRP